MANPTDNTIARTCAILYKQDWPEAEWPPASPQYEAEIRQTVTRVIEASGLLSTAQQTEELREALEPFANLADANMNDPLHKWLTTAHIKNAEAVMGHTVEIKPEP